MSAMDDVFGHRPERPNHPDFWLLSELVLKLDGRMDDTPADQRQAAWKEAVTKHVDLDSISYMAMQRALRATGGQEQLAKMLAALYIDAFIFGCEFSDRKHERDTG